MKRVRKVKRVSMGSALIILVVLVVALSQNGSEDLFTMTPATALEGLTTSDHLVSAEEIENHKAKIVDIRTSYEFEQGHLNGALNIPAATLLTQENQSLFREWDTTGEMVVLYGKDVEQANIPFLMLYQMGYENIRLLNTDQRLVQDRLISEKALIEEPRVNIREFIDASVARARLAEEKAKVKPVEKKIIPVKKKKKRPVEGGC